MVLKVFRITVLVRVPGMPPSNAERAGGGTSSGNSIFDFQIPLNAPPRISLRSSTT
jgi:hypothetical protein